MIGIDFEHHYLYAKVLIDWKSLVLQLKGSRMVFSLPSCTYMLFPQHFLLRRLNRNTCTARLLMSQHGFLHDLQPIKLEQTKCDAIYTQTDVFELPNFSHANSTLCHTRCTEQCPLMRKPSAPSTSSLLSQDDTLFVSRNGQSVTYKRPATPATQRSLPPQPTGIRTNPHCRPKNGQTSKSSSIPNSASPAAETADYIYPLLPSQQFFEDGR